MSKLWTKSWEYSWTYWRTTWKQTWLVPMGLAVIALVLWSVVNPAVVPFLFFRIQPINDPVIGALFDHNLIALRASLERTALSSVVLLALGVGLGVRGGGRALTMRNRVMGTIMASILLILSWGTLAIMGVPIFPGKGHLGINIGFSTILIMVVLPIVFWWWPWRVSHPKGSFGDFAGWFMRSVLEKLMMVWGWLLGMVVTEMLAAGIAWTTFSPLVGMVALSALSIGFLGFVWKAASYYGMDIHDPNDLEVRCETALVD